jgi:hypothetical protein
LVDQHVPTAGIVRDGSTDLVFGEATNDLIVPERGGFAAKGTTRFLIADALDLGVRDRFDHRSYGTAQRVPGPVPTEVDQDAKASTDERARITVWLGDSPNTAR